MCIGTPSVWDSEFYARFTKQYGMQKSKMMKVVMCNWLFFKTPGTNSDMIFVPLIVFPIEIIATEAVKVPIIVSCAECRYRKFAIEPREQPI